MDKPWGSLDPNSANQLWSRWTFIVYASKRLPLKVVRENAGRWLRKGFGSVGQARVYERRRVNGSARAVVIEAEVEGVAAHDPGYVAHVGREFQQNFVAKGWGPLAVSTTEVEILAGDAEDGKPPAQVVVLPTIRRG